MAVGVDAGVLFPGEGLNAGPVVNGLWEYYFTPRAGLRTTFGWANPKREDSADAYLRTYKLTMDLLYNWEGGKVHPFVGAGGGVWFMQHRDLGEDIGEGDNKPGITFGGGLDIFITRTATVKLEGRYDWVKVDDGRLDPSGVSLTVGLKKFF